MDSNCEKIHCTTDISTENRDSGNDPNSHVVPPETELVPDAIEEPIVKNNINDIESTCKEDKKDLTTSMTDIQHIDTPVKRKRGRPRKIRDGVNRNSQDLSKETMMNCNIDPSYSNFSSYKKSNLNSNGVYFRYPEASQEFSENLVIRGKGRGSKRGKCRERGRGREKRLEVIKKENGGSFDDLHNAHISRNCGIKQHCDGGAPMKPQYAKRGKPFVPVTYSSSGRRHKRRRFSDSVTDEEMINEDKVSVCYKDSEICLNCTCPTHILKFRKAMSSLENLRRSFRTFIFALIQGDENTLQCTEVIDEFAKQIMNMVMERKPPVIAVNLEDNVKLENLKCIVNICSSPKRCLESLKVSIKRILDFTLDGEFSTKNISPSLLNNIVKHIQTAFNGQDELNETTMTLTKTPSIENLPSLSDRVINEIVQNGMLDSMMY